MIVPASLPRAESTPLPLYQSRYTVIKQGVLYSFNFRKPLLGPAKRRGKGVPIDPAQLTGFFFT